MPIVAGHHAILETLTAEQLSLRLQEVLRAAPRGSVALTNATGEEIGCLWFQQGYLLWTTGGEHRWKRWKRLVRQHCLGLDPFPDDAAQAGTLFSGSSVLEALSWELAMLERWVQRQSLAPEAARGLVQASLLEGLFDIFQAAALVSRMTIQLQEEPIAVGSRVLEGSVNGLTLLNTALQTWQAWSAAGLSAYGPNLAPVVRNADALQQRTSPQTYQTLVSLLNGQCTLRDLAVFMKQDLQMLTQTLVAYAQWDLIGLEAIADLPAPATSRLNSTANSTANPAAIPSTPSVVGNTAATSAGTINFVADAVSDAPLICCIDDNPKVCEMLGKILMSAGYRYASVQDSLQALPVLLEEKPDLIFLDLVMPVASGYEVCTQIRRISTFKDTPIVILTGNDGIVDRIRAKASGSTDFISKPLDVQKVLSTIRRYIPDRVPAAAMGV